MLLIWALVFSCFSYSNAQDVQTTPNLIQPYGWSGCLTQHNGWIWGGNVGGPCPVQRSGDGAILFSYGSSTINQTIAINQALSGTGIQVRGFSYGWTIKNANAGAGQSPSSDPLQITIGLYDAAKKEVESKSYDYSMRINDWTRYSGTHTFNNVYSLSAVDTLRVSITSRDAGNWAGYYGPEINNIDVRLRYSIDPCAANPLSSPSCSGYAEAYRAQMCLANPLFDSSCPGYAEAFKTQQCSVNALFDPTCPGYATAYFNQQCTANPLYNEACPGYSTAYFKQQCSIDPLYSVDCPGYAAAYFNQRCTINALYSVDCPGYAAAYFNQQCSMNMLYSPQCPGYMQAYFEQQCNLTALYDSRCPGYAEAYRQKLFTDSCRANAQSNPQCPGYAATMATVPISQITANSDPIKDSTAPSATNDPVVNQALAAPNNTTSSPTASSSNTVLGPGFNLGSVAQSQQRPSGTVRERSSSMSSTRTAAARTMALQSVAQAEQVVLNAQEQQQADMISSMGTVPGFDTYSATRIPDAAFYTPREIYRNATIPDNRRAQRALSERSDRIHQQIVDSQYNLERLGETR